MVKQPTRIRVEVEGRELELSNLDKVLYPAAGFTKGEVIDYYTRVGPILLPHLRDRPLTRIRYPNGVDGPSFFEKNAPGGTPNWVRLKELPAPGSSQGRETIDFVVCDDLPTLVWLANLAALELHTPQWRIGRSKEPKPDLLVVDLDPGAPAGLAECARSRCCCGTGWRRTASTATRRPPARRACSCAARSPATQSAEIVTGYAKGVAEELEKAHPRLIVSKMAKSLRPGKVFIDWSQNNAAKTTVAPYSLRAQPTPTVSTPLTWDEVEDGAVRQFTAARCWTASRSSAT